MSHVSRVIQTPPHPHEQVEQSVDLRGYDFAVRNKLTKTRRYELLRVNLTFILQLTAEISKE